MTTDLSKDEKDIRMSMLRDALPACQPQEGSPPSTFTESEKEQLQAVFPEMNLVARSGVEPKKHDNLIDICDPHDFQKPKHQFKKQDTQVIHENAQEALWHGAPRMDNAQEARDFRMAVRQGIFQGPTNGVCPGFMQCNLVVLPQGQVAFDFLLFCQRNKKACPLIEVCDVGSPFPNGVAKGADLRTDVPMYAIYRDGKLEKEVSDATEYWPENSVAFLIGCSFSYDGALLDAHIPLRSAEEGKNVPMYRTNLKCRSSGALSGNTVVSMKPIKATDIAKEVEITSKYPHAHGGPVCVGNPKAIGIQDLDKPDWGDQIDVRDDEVPVFHACGVTPQAVLMDSKVPFAITHKAGYMFVTDLPADAPP
jgi:uncharacterized protein YcsI (UPF0317 family)